MHREHGDAIRHEWLSADNPTAALYRDIMQRDWPLLARTSAKGKANLKARGACIGLSRNQSGMAYCATIPGGDVLAKMIAASIESAVPGFVYTTVQVTIDLCSIQHIDAGNQGPSIAIALGPHFGGILWTMSEKKKGSLSTLENWTQFDGRIPHGTMPFCGSRVSLIAFTSSAACAAVAKRPAEVALKMGMNFSIEDIGVPGKWATSETPQVSLEDSKVDFEYFAESLLTACDDMNCGDDCMTDYETRSISR